MDTSTTLPALVMFITLLGIIISFISITNARHKNESRYIQTMMEYELLKERKTKHGKEQQEQQEQQKQQNSVNLKQVVTNKKPHEELEERMIKFQQQAHVHSNMQFYVGLIMSIVGFILLVGLIIFVSGSEKTVSSAISIVGSLIFEGISLMFLKESQKLRIRVKEYHDSVTEDYKRKRAIGLADNIQDEKLRSLVQAQLAFQLMGIDAGTLNISNFSADKSSPTKDDSK